MTRVRPFFCLALLAASGTLPLRAQTLDAAQQSQLQTLRGRAEAGNLDAQVALGNLYEAGDGVAEDRAAAAAWYLKAASAGHVGAQTNLAAMYLDGLGVARDPIAAAHGFAAPRMPGIRWRS